MIELEDIKAGDEVLVFRDRYTPRPTRAFVERTSATQITVNGIRYTRRRGYPVSGQGNLGWIRRYSAKLAAEYEERATANEAAAAQRESIRRLAHRIGALDTAVMVAAGESFQFGRTAEVAALEAAVAAAEDGIRAALGPLTERR